MTATNDFEVASTSALASWTEDTLRDPSSREVFCLQLVHRLRSEPVTYNQSLLLSELLETILYRGLEEMRAGSTA